MYDKDNLFKALGLDIDEMQKNLIAKQILSILDYEPKIGILGKTGVGKSSLCNALFGKELFNISDVEACTRNVQEEFLRIGDSKGLKLIDVPGVGESRDRDKEYAKLYAELIPKLDLVLWVIKADDRALSSDESFYKNIVKPHIKEGKPFFFVLNQIDKIEPLREWDIERHIPGLKQFQNINAKVSEVARFFEVPVSRIIYVSASERYNLTELVNEIVFALPKERKITFFKEVNAEFQSEVAGEHVKKSFLDVFGDVVVDVLEIAGDTLVKVKDSIGEAAENLFDNVIENAPAFIVGAAKKIIGGCYITTAVCTYLGKPDDCYELTQLRKFRDEWLRHQPDGPALIEEYYAKAPIIVEKLDKRKDRDEIYYYINNVYLLPCVKLIKEEKYEECKKLYLEMVKELENRFNN